MECPNLQENLKDCTCTYTSCGKRGQCCLCIAQHRASGEVPGCLFPADVERTYDRSIKRFIRSFK